MSLSDSATHSFQTSLGEIVGIKENGIIKVKGIRYAYSERYKKPVPVKSLELKRDQDRIPVCPQVLRPLIERMIGKTDPEKYEVNESPQYLSITRPDNFNEKIPVIVWIHGGSHEIGGGDIPTSDPSNWVKEQNIIVVTISFRLGLFGFLGGTEDRPANLGLHDIIEALKWVKANIQSFGGNSENITLFGQSSGGDAIAHLMISQGVENLFHKVIIQSAPLGLRENRKKMTAEFLKRTENFKYESEVTKMTDEYRKHVPSIIKYGLKAGMPFGIQYGFSPVCNENEVVEKWKDSAGKYDVLIGMNDFETMFFLDLSKIIGKSLGKKLIRSTTEKIYETPAKQFAQNYADAGGNVYLFRIHSGVENNLMSAGHCIDLPLIFGNKEAWRSAELIKDIPWEFISENGKKLRAVWADFARDGNISDHSEKPTILEIKKINKTI